MRKKYFQLLFLILTIYIGSIHFVSARAPVAIGNSREYVVVIGGSIEFDASGSYDTDGFIVKYLWDFGDGTSSDLVNPSHVYQKTGEYSVKLTVTDDSGEKGEFTSIAIVEEPNKPPVPVTNGPYYGKTGVGLHFNSSGSYDVDGEILRYRWYFGDNTSIGAINPVHAYNKSGEYIVTLMLKDNDLAITNATTTAYITDNIPPVSIIIGPTDAKVGEPVTFSSINSYDEDGFLIGHHWEIDDGAVSDRVNITNIFTHDGQNRVTLTVTDNDGFNSSSFVDIKVNDNIAPVIVIDDPYSGLLNENITFTSRSYDPDGEIISTSWDFGDGEISNEVSTNHTYSKAGNYYGVIRVTDNNGEQTSKYFEITIIAPEKKPIFPYYTILIIVSIMIVVLYSQKNKLMRLDFK